MEKSIAIQHEIALKTPPQDRKLYGPVRKRRTTSMRPTLRQSARSARHDSVKTGRGPHSDTPPLRGPSRHCSLVKIGRYFVLRDERQPLARFFLERITSGRVNSA